MKKSWMGIGLLTALIGIAGWNLYEDRRDITRIETAGIIVQNDPNGPAVGSRAPDFQLKAASGRAVKLSDYRGEKVLLNFWATWCPPCKTEMPHMQSFYEEQEGQAEMLAVNYKESRRTAADFARQYKLTFPVLLDETGEVADTYQIYSMPTTYVIDETGVITEKVVGPMDQEMIRKLLK